MAHYLRDNPANRRWQVLIDRRRTMVKAFGFGHGGFFNQAKRQEQGLFASPRPAGHWSLLLSRTELAALLEGIDVTVRRHRKRYVAPLAST